MPGSGKSNMKSIDNSRKFAEGKRCALDIIKNVGNLFQTVDKAMHEARDDVKAIFETYTKTKNWFEECKKIYKNEKLKVAIFGSTSSGKSTTVNAILHKTLLASGMGHVTNCIYKIEGSDDGKREEITFKIDEGEEEDISKLMEYLDHEQGGDLSLDRVVYITCPKLEYSALKDVIILDCPGLSRSREHDRLISDHCRDADVFVHVVDAKSTIRTTEKTFFERIKYRTVFVLFNCWDLIDEEKNSKLAAENLRRKHQEEACIFLKESNAHLTEKTLADKIYFVSAKEYLSVKESFKEKAGEVLDYTEFGLLIKSVGNAISPWIPLRKSLARQRFEEFVEFENTFWRYTTDSALNTKFGSRTATEKQLLQDLQTAIGSIIDTGRLANFDEKRKRQQKWTANAILELMEESTILRFASTYKPASSKPELELESYVKGLHDHLLKEVNRRLRDINIFTKHAKCPETGSFFERIQSKGSHNELEQLLKNNVREVTLEPLKIHSVDYSWCFGPYALWKRLRYTSNYANQSTTSTVRAFLQTGGIGGAATGCVVAVSAPYSIPLIVISAVGGAAFTYWRNSADKENWTVERQIEYIQNCCAAHIHIQFKKKYKSEWCQDKLDKEIYDYLRKLLEKHRGQHIKITNKNITALQEQLEKVKFDDNLSKEINRLEEFERIYLPENVESSSENEGDQKTEDLSTRNKPANFPCTVI